MMRETKKAILTEEEQGIIYIRLKKDSHIEVNDIIDINRAKDELAGNRHYAVIFIPHQTSSITPEARKKASAPEFFLNAVCKTIVANTFFHKVIGNFFINLSRPPVPMKLFSNEVSALNWVKERMNHEQIKMTETV